MSKVQIGNQTWGSKAAALEAIYRIRDSVQDGKPILGISAELLTAATDLHADAAQKRGCGISHFTVAKGRAGKRHFVLHRTDGSSTDISFRDLWVSDKARANKDRMKALRDTIETQVEPMRKPGHDVDHYPVTFATLVKEWLATRSLTLEQLEVVPTEDNQVHVALENEELAADWFHYHWQHAQYRVIPTVHHRRGLP